VPIARSQPRRWRWGYAPSPSLPWDTAETCQSTLEDGPGGGERAQREASGHGMSPHMPPLEGISARTGLVVKNGRVSTRRKWIFFF
jgi:hypothetical protein